MKVTKYSFEINNLEKFTINPIKIEPVEIGDLNLLVGRNASGKTTLTDRLSNFADLFTKSPALFLGKWNMEWKLSENTTYSYCYQLNFIKEKIIVEEYLKENDNILIERTLNKCRIYSNEWKDFEEINPPTDKLILHVRRDEKHYPYLEEIVKWAEGVHSFKFGHIHAPDFIPNALDKKSLPNIKDKDFNKILGDLDESIKGKIISDFNLLGYNVEILKIKKEGEQNILFIKEEGLQYEIRYSNLSQGMFRSLSLLIFIQYLIEKEHSQLIIIDDLCEGLDYDRATRLGKIIFDRMKEKDIQFVATSNDSFLMNVVDIEHWNIIHREGSTIKSYNYKNSKDKFEQFKMTGLNNFDLFASNFLQN
jgi:hypothetical protein